MSIRERLKNEPVVEAFATTIATVGALVGFDVPEEVRYGVGALVAVASAFWARRKVRPERNVLASTEDLPQLGGPFGP